VITSRTLASEVVDSLGLRLYVVQPPRVVRSTLIAHAKFAPDAPSVQYSVTKLPAGREVRVLPEDSVKTLGARPRIRRYRLASVGRRSELGETDLAMASLARELGRMR